MPFKVLMKNKSLLLFIAMSFFFCQCSSRTEVSPQFDFHQESTKLMKDLTPQLVGEWKLEQLHINYEDHKIYQNNKLGLSKDTVFKDFATLHIELATNQRNPHTQAEHPEFEGFIQYQEKTYPIYFRLIAGPRVVNPEGPYAFFLLEYNFPVGTRIPEPEEEFLKDAGFVNDNFSLELVQGRPKMIWRGLNRGISKIELRKL